MGRFYKVDIRGKNWLQRVASAPAWTSDDEGRIIYDEAAEAIKFGTASAWSNAGAYNDVPLNTILLIESDIALTGYTLLTNKDDDMVYVTKGSGAGGEAGGSDKSSGTWTQPNHDHSVAAHTHGLGSHAHSLNSHTHTVGSHTHPYSGGTGFEIAIGVNRASGGNSSHTHNFSGTTSAGSGSSGAAVGNTGNS